MQANPSDQIVRKNWRVVTHQAVASRDQAVAARVRGGPNDSMHNQQVSAGVHHDVSTETSFELTGWMVSTSPGWMAGTMLVPAAGNRMSPHLRTDSASSRHTAPLDT